MQNPYPKEVPYFTLFLLPAFGLLAGGICGLIVFPLFHWLFARQYSLESEHQWQHDTLINCVIWFPIIAFGIAVAMCASASSHNAGVQFNKRRQEAEDEAAQDRVDEAARARYVKAYNEFLPRWQAWPEASNAASRHNAALQKERAAMLAFWERISQEAETAANIITELLYRVEGKATVKYGITDSRKLADLKKAAVKAAKSKGVDLGAVRLPDPSLVFYIMPRPSWPRAVEQLQASADYRIIVNALPPFPYGKELHELKERADQPEKHVPPRPSAPENLWFWNADGKPLNYETNNSRPIPPEKMTFGRK